MVSIGFADHVGRVLFTVCVDDRQPFVDPGKTLGFSEAGLMLNVWSGSSAQLMR